MLELASDIVPPAILEPMLAVATPPEVSDRESSIASEIQFAQYWQLALAAPVFGLVAIGTLQFTWLLVAEAALRTATDSAVQEALLPKATLRSVSTTLRHELTARSWADKVDPPRITVNGHSTVATIAPRSGDEVVVSVSVDASAVAHDLLRCIGLPLGGLKLQASARAIMP